MGRQRAAWAAGVCHCPNRMAKFGRDLSESRADSWLRARPLRSFDAAPRNRGPV